MAKAARANARVGTNRAKSARVTTPGGARPLPPASAPQRPLPGIRMAAELLKQASEPTRLQILIMLGEADRNVTDFCVALPSQSQPAVSHHISLLCHGRLIERRRSGKHNFYGLTEAGRGMLRIVRSLMV